MPRAIVSQYTCTYEISAIMKNLAFRRKRETVSFSLILSFLLYKTYQNNVVNIISSVTVDALKTTIKNPRINNFELDYSTKDKTVEIMFDHPLFQPTQKKKTFVNYGQNTITNQIVVLMDRGFDHISDKQAQETDFIYIWNSDRVRIEDKLIPELKKSIKPFKKLLLSLELKRHYTLNLY